MGLKAFGRFSRNQAEKDKDGLADSPGGAAEAEERYSNLQAEFNKFRLRTLQQADQNALGARRELLLDLLQVVDDFELAIRSSHFPDTNWGQGIQSVFRGMLKFMEDKGVTPIETQAAQFDPTRHEAVQLVRDPSVPDGIVIRETRPGFMFEGEVLRPAQVWVNRITEDEE